MSGTNDAPEFVDEIVETTPAAEPTTGEAETAPGSSEEAAPAAAEDEQAGDGESGDTEV